MVMEINTFFSFKHIRHLLGKFKVLGAGFEPEMKESLNEIKNKIDGLSIIDERSKRLEFLTSVVEERSRTLESLLYVIEERSRMLENLLIVQDQRSQTLEYLINKGNYAAQYQIDQVHKIHIDILKTSTSYRQLTSYYNSTGVLELITEFPIATESNDHISPDSTIEGLFRPVPFVKDCIRILGQEIKCLDLGTGAAGTVFEFVMNKVIAVGIDGSDYCRANDIGYWPVLTNNLFTCDITKPFSFLFKNTGDAVHFDVITIWEVLEHIHERDLSELLTNVSKLLSEQGYFIGSISLVEYVDRDGIPYHVTLKPKQWWKQKFLENKLIMLEEHPFNERIFCRGNGPRYQDFHNYEINPNEGFWFVAQKL